METSMGKNKSALILHYVGIAAKELTEKDPKVLADIAIEKAEIAKALDMTLEEIVLECGQQLPYLKN
jgi:hypothetical protein